MGIIFKRLMLVLAVCLVVLLLVEGALSLFTGRSLRSRLFSDTVRFMQTDGERFAAAASQPGIYRLHEDPLVRFVLRYADSLDAKGWTITPTWAGLRARPQGPVPEDAQRIVILGDSVAFGRGLNDEETIACHLERILAASRGPDAPPVACLTVAQCRWNHRNAIQYLMDYFDVIDPDIVLYMPIPNDLTDSFGMNESGHLTLMNDLAQDDPWLMVNAESPLMYKFHMVERAKEGTLSVSTTEEDLGPAVLRADLTRESRLRFDDNARSIATLAKLLERTGRKLMIMHYFETGAVESYVKILRERLLDLGLSIPEVPLFTTLPPACMISEIDPHPSSQGAFTVALWAAEELLKRNWVSPCAAHALPAPLPEAVSRRATLPGPEEIRTMAAEIREELKGRLMNRVNLETAYGFDQVFGGVNHDGSLAIRFLAVLKADGPSLCVKLGALEGVTHLYPLEVEVEVDGVHVGLITVPPARDKSQVEKWFDLPEREDPSAPLEVRLSPRHWVARTIEFRTLLASCRLISISCPGP